MSGCASTERQGVRVRVGRGACASMKSSRAPHEEWAKMKIGSSGPRAGMPWRARATAEVESMASAGAAMARAAMRALAIGEREAMARCMNDSVSRTCYRDAIGEARTHSRGVEVGAMTRGEDARDCATPFHQRTNANRDRNATSITCARVPSGITFHPALISVWMQGNQCLSEVWCDPSSEGSARADRSGASNDSYFRHRPTAEE